MLDNRGRRQVKHGVRLRCSHATLDVEMGHVVNIVEVLCAINLFVGADARDELIVILELHLMLAVVGRQRLLAIRVACGSYVVGYGGVLARRGRQVIVVPELRII